MNKLIKLSWDVLACVAQLDGASSCTPHRDNDKCDQQNLEEEPHLTPNRGIAQSWDGEMGIEEEVVDD